MQKYFPQFYPGGAGTAFSFGALVANVALIAAVTIVVVPMVKKAI